MSSLSERIGEFLVLVFLERHVALELERQGADVPRKPTKTERGSGNAHLERGVTIVVYGAEDGDVIAVCDALEKLLQAGHGIVAQSRPRVCRVFPAADALRAALAFPVFFGCGKARPAMPSWLQHISGHLFVGDRVAAQSAEVFEQICFCAVVNCTPPPPHPKSVPCPFTNAADYLRVGLDDQPSEDLLSHLSRACQCLQNGPNTSR